MNNWVSADEFARLSGKHIDDVKSLCQDGRLASIIDEKGQLMVEISLGSQIVLATNTAQMDAGLTIDRGFIEKTLGTIMGLHEKVIEAKDETLDALRQENQFLKEALLSMQDIYETDRSTIGTLTEQLSVAQEELEFAKRKYKLMWGQVIEKHAN